MLQLHTMAPAYGLPTFTPFGLKVIAHMRLAGVPFELVTEHVPGRGPKKKFPWLVDGDTLVSDSGFIIEHLVAHHGALLDEDLSQRERAVAHALRRMVEESLCFAIAYTRWVDEEICRQALSTVLVAIPLPVRAVVAPLVRRRLLRDLWGQGVARHTPDEVAALAGADLRAFSIQLGEAPYMMGAKPCSLDTSVASFLAVIQYAPFETSLKHILAQLPNLVAYCDRMRAICFAALKTSTTSQ